MSMSAVSNISLRQLAKILGVSQPFSSQIRARKRPLPEALGTRLEALGAYYLLINKVLEVERMMGDGVRRGDSIPPVAPAYASGMQ